MAKQVTEDQALSAVRIIQAIIIDAFGKDLTYKKAQINLRPSMVKLMYTLCAEIEYQNKPETGRLSLSVIKSEKYDV